MKKDKTVKTLEEIRELQKTTRENRRVLFYVLLLLIPMDLVFTYLAVSSGDIAGTCVPLIAFYIMTAATFYAWVRVPRELYREYKTYLVNSAADGLFDEYQYFPDGCFDREVLEETNLLDLEGKKFESNDFFEGTYQGVRFARADIEIYNGLPGQFKKQYFGNWNVFSFSKASPRKIWISTRKLFTHSRLRTEYIQFSNNGENGITTGDDYFDSLFFCGCEDEQAARELLTPQLMKILRGFYNKNGYPFIVAWVDGRLHVIVEDKKDTVHPSVDMDVNPVLEIEKAREDLKFVCDIVDELVIGDKVFSEYAMYGQAVDSEPVIGKGLRRQ